MTSPQVRLLEVDEQGDGQRIDNFLLRHLKGAPRTLIYRVLRTGEVRVNKGRVKARHKLSLGDLVRVPPLRLSEEEVAPPPAKSVLERIERSVLFEDELLLVVNKPAGLAVHGGSGISYGVIEALRVLRPELKNLELAHRLDRDTSGLLMLAKKPGALRTLQQLQLSGQVDKRYLALLDGKWRRGKENVQAPLQKNTLKSGERVVRVDPEGKPAQTLFEVKQRFSEATLVEAELKTGRTHQIRVHAAWLGTPILGDEKYGRDESNKKYRQLGLDRLFLHAASLKFPWPGQSKGYEFHAPLPEELNMFIEKLK